MIGRVRRRWGGKGEWGEMGVRDAAVCVKCCKNHLRPTMAATKMRTKGDEEMPGTSVGTMQPHHLTSPGLSPP